MSNHRFRFIYLYIPGAIRFQPLNDQSNVCCSMKPLGTFFCVNRIIIFYPFLFYQFSFHDPFMTSWKQTKLAHTNVKMTHNDFIWFNVKKTRHLQSYGNKFSARIWHFLERYFIQWTIFSEQLIKRSWSISNSLKLKLISTTCIKIFSQKVFPTTWWKKKVFTGRVCRDWRADLKQEKKSSTTK